MTSEPGRPARTGESDTSRLPITMRSGRARTKRVDRARWRRQLRSRPRLRGAYRIGVGVAGVSIMLLAISIGWLPGPGGIPLFLVGLAVLATEFVWAARVLIFANRTVRNAAKWHARQPRWVHRALTVALICGISFGIWLSLAIFGLPGWLPSWLDVLPGVHRAGG